MFTSSNEPSSFSTSGAKLAYAQALQIISINSSRVASMCLALSISSTYVSILRLNTKGISLAANPSLTNPAARQNSSNSSCYIKAFCPGSECLPLCFE